MIPKFFPLFDLEKKLIPSVKIIACNINENQVVNNFKLNG